MYIVYKHTCININLVLCVNHHIIQVVSITAWQLQRLSSKREGWGGGGGGGVGMTQGG